MKKHLRASRLASVGLSMVIMFIAAFTMLLMAKAQALNDLASTICSNSHWCARFVNKSAGDNAAALVGQVNINTNTNPNPPLSAFFQKSALRGVDLARDSSTDTNAGVVGKSLHGLGVVGVTAFNGGVTPSSNATGVIGLDLSKSVNSTAGVGGISLRNDGVFGLTLGTKINQGLGVGVGGASPFGIAGVFGMGGHDNASGICGCGVVGGSGNGIGGDFFNKSARYEALHVINGGKGPLIEAQDRKLGVAMLLDNDGNLTISGQLTSGSNLKAVARTSTGERVVTYPARQSIATIEDFGEGQLVHGRAIVRFDPSFASAIDASAYMVFLTPQGDAGALYVARKTAVGFLVREHGGESNVAFDYRIVARPFGVSEPRLPRYVPATDETDSAKSEMLRNVDEAAQRMMARVDSIRP